MLEFLPGMKDCQNSSKIPKNNPNIIVKKYEDLKSLIFDFKQKYPKNEYSMKWIILSYPKLNFPDNELPGILEIEIIINEKRKRCNLLLFISSCQFKV